MEGVGSGRFGEKELFSRFYVRVLSAQPVRDAYLRVRQSLETKAEAGEAEPKSLLQDPRLDQFWAIAVTFRSNDPDLAREVINTLQAQATDTVRNRAYLSTTDFPQHQIIAYSPSVDSAIGAVFFFPRSVGQTPVISSRDSEFVFDLEFPDEHQTKIRVTFPITPEMLAQSVSSRFSDQTDPIAFAKMELGIAAGIESGRVAAVVNRFPRQSANNLHGSVYWFHRNDNLDARNFFDEVGKNLPEFKRHQFGLSLGTQLGPRFNLFFSYDGLRILRGSTRLSLVPSAAMKRGDFSELLDLEVGVTIVDPQTGSPFPGNRIPQHRLHPAALGLIQLLPDPNRDDPVRNFVNNQPAIEDSNTFTIRTDFNPNSASSLTFSYQKPNAKDIGVHSLPAFGYHETDSQHELELGYQRSFGSYTTAEFRLGFEREHEQVSTRDPRPAGLVRSLGIEGIAVSDPKDEGYPLIELEDYQGFGDEDLPENDVGNDGFFSGSVSFALGEHVLEISGELGFEHFGRWKRAGWWFELPTGSSTSRSAPLITRISWAAISRFTIDRAHRLPAIVPASNCRHLSMMKFR